MNAEEVKHDSRGVVTLRELASQGNFFAQNFEKWWHLGHDLFSKPDTDVQKIFGDFLFDSLVNFDDLASLKAEYRKKMNHDLLIKIFRETLDTIQGDIRNHMVAFMPPENAEFERLQLNSSAEKQNHDPIEMIRKIYETNETRRVSTCQFKTLRSLEMAAFYCFISATRYQNREEDGSNDDEMALKFLAWLDPGFNHDKPRLEIGLDPKKQWKVESYRLPGFQMPKRKSGLSYVEREVLRVCFNARRFPGQKINAIVQARRKSLFEAFAKRFRDLQSPIWPDVPDLFGIRLIYYTNYRAMKNGLDTVSRRAIWNNNPAVRYCHTTNKHSQKKMRIKNQRVFVSGRQSEIQHIRLEDWANIEYSSAPENHARYHLRWFSDQHGIFMNMFPPALYGVDWTSDAVFQSLDQHVVRQVKERNEQMASETKPV